MLIVYGNDYKSPLLANLPSSIKVLSTHDIQSHYFSKTEAICATHEEAVEAVQLAIPNHINSEALQLFRNKALLRVKTSNWMPDFYFKKINLAHLDKQSLDFKKFKKYVIKPVKGFFSIGVHLITPETDLMQLKATITAEMIKQGKDHPGYLSSDSLSSHDFLIEAYLGTQSDNTQFSLATMEVAIDGYYNAAGDFTLLSIYHHPYRNDLKYFHTLYYTCQSLYTLLAQQVGQFFNHLRQALGIVMHNFPVHAEFKYCNGQLFLIEVNPGRFGGLGLSDLNYYAFGINPYQLFFSNQPFDWKNAWEKTQPPECCFAWTLAYTGEHCRNTCFFFNHDQFKNFLGEGLLYYEVITYDEEVAAIAFLKKRDPTLLEPLVSIDFDQFMSRR